MIQYVAVLYGPHLKTHKQNTFKWTSVYLLPSINSYHYFANLFVFYRGKKHMKVCHLNRFKEYSTIMLTVCRLLCNQSLESFQLAKLRLYTHWKTTHLPILFHPSNLRTFYFLFLLYCISGDIQCDVEKEWWEGTTLPCTWS